MNDVNKFQKLVTIANQVATKFNGSRDTCILTSFALHDVLQRLGYNSRPLRIEAAVFPDDQNLVATSSVVSNEAQGAQRLQTCGGVISVWLLIMTGCWIPHSIKRTSANGRRASGRSRSGSQKNSGLSGDRSWYGRMDAPCDFLRIHDKTDLPMLATLGRRIGGRSPIGSFAPFSKQSRRIVPEVTNDEAAAHARSART
jgi:hypothetical protein